MFSLKKLDGKRYLMHTTYLNIQECLNAKQIFLGLLFAKGRSHHNSVHTYVRSILLIVLVVSF